MRRRASREESQRRLSARGVEVTAQQSPRSFVSEIRPGWVRCFFRAILHRAIEHSVTMPSSFDTSPASARRSRSGARRQVDEDRRSESNSSEFGRPHSRISHVETTIRTEREIIREQKWAVRVAFDAKQFLPCGDNRTRLL